MPVKDRHRPGERSPRQRPIMSAGLNERRCGKALQIVTSESASQPSHPRPSPVEFLRGWRQDTASLARYPGPSGQFPGPLESLAIGRERRLIRNSSLPGSRPECAQGSTPTSQPWVPERRDCHRGQPSRRTHEITEPGTKSCKTVAQYDSNARSRSASPPIRPLAVGGLRVRTEVNSRYFEPG